MLTWLEKKDIYGNILLTAKSKDAIVLTCDADISSGKNINRGPAGNIRWVRIRSIWNTREDFYPESMKDLTQPMAVIKGIKVDSIDVIKAYCEKRWAEWCTKAGLTEISTT